MYVVDGHGPSHVNLTEPATWLPPFDNGELDLYGINKYSSLFRNVHGRIESVPAKIRIDTPIFLLWLSFDMEVFILKL